MSELEELYKMIDRKFEHMTDEELDEWDYQQSLKLKKMGGKTLDARKKSGYKSRHAKLKRQGRVK